MNTWIHGNVNRVMFLPHFLYFSVGMEQQKGDILALQKDPVVRGTYEPSAFILSLRDPEEFRTIHSFGFHRIPHIGTTSSSSFKGNMNNHSLLTSICPTPFCGI